MTGTTRGRAIRFDEPAAEWIEGVPVGNGRLGAMVYGGTASERVQCNEETLWAGGHEDKTNSEASAHLDEVRELCFAGEFERAQELCNEHMLGEPPGIRPYLPFCDLLIDQPGHDAATDYRRELDLADGILRVSYEVDGTRYRREYFASAPDDVLVVRIESDEPGAVDAGVRLDRERGARSTAVDDDRVLLRGQVIDLPNVADMDQGPGGWGLRFEGQALVRADGGAVAAAGSEERNDWDGSEEGVVAADADAVTVLFTGATSLSDDPPAKDGVDPSAACEETLAAAAEQSYAELRSRHVGDHRELFERVEIDLGEPVDAPTDERLAAVQAGGSDPDLAALYFQYGRYLLMASSRPGTLPANLQGIWNEEYEPPWHSCFTLDVNLEMNYWHAEVANLRECAEPLVAFVDSMRPSGRETAREHYDCEGFTAHVDTDLWRTTAQTVDAHWGFWPMAPAWLCQNLWERYAFSGDDADLERIYPVLREAAAFLRDYLVEHPDEGWLVTAPSASPENQFRTADGQEATTCVAPTMDVQLITDLFAHCIEAADRLDRDADFAADLADALDRLPPMQIGERGQLQEWLEDYEEVNPGHRHVSHLVGFYPADVIGLREDPDLAEAVRTSLERRLDHGGGHTGWSCAWTICLFARLEDGERAREHVLKLLRDSTYDNLLDSHPPFQIDGNFGGAAGIAEMLLGSHGGEIRLLPALPDAWDEGRVGGLRARGGYELDISWSDGSLDEATVSASRDGRCRIRTYDAVVERIEMTAGGTAEGGAVDVDRPEDGVVAFDAAADATYRLVAAGSGLD